MKMDYAGTACSLMEIIHILSHYCHVIILFQLSQAEMRGIRSHCIELGTSDIIEIQNHSRIAIPSLDRSDILDLEIIP